MSSLSLTEYPEANPMTQVEKIKKTATVAKDHMDKTAKFGNYSTIKTPTEQNHINFSPRKHSLGGIYFSIQGKRKVHYHKFRKWGGLERK